MKLLNSVLFIYMVFVSFNYLDEENEKNNVYSFINYKANKLEYYYGLQNYRDLFLKFDQLILERKGKIKVLHIGDSHLQADYFSGRMRKGLYELSGGLSAGRGFIFLHEMANTNNAPNYDVIYTGNWKNDKITEHENTQDFGLFGMTVFTSDKSVGIKINPDYTYYHKDNFNRIKVFYNTKNTDYKVEIANATGKYRTLINEEKGYVIFFLSDYMDTLELKIYKKSQNKSTFKLYGIELDRSNSGVSYSTIGVNGASVKSFLKPNDMFETQIKTIEPQWIIVSLGANDSYVKKFDSVEFEKNYNFFVRRLQKAMPNVPILLTTPSDNYFKRKSNSNVACVNRIIRKVAMKNRVAVWDLYKIMGGRQSMNIWHNRGLAADDKVHFKIKGYHIQGNLLFAAFLKSYFEDIKKRIQNK